MTHAPAARPDQIRRHNLGLTLSQIHLDGALSRAELTQRLGVSRSTVGALVGDLEALGLVVETVPVGGSGPGRPSHVVVPSPTGPWVCAVDVDVDLVAVAAVALNGQVLARTSVAIDASRFAPRDLAAIVSDQLPELTRRTGRGSRPVGLGISIPGTVDTTTGRIGVAPNLGWRDVELAEELCDDVAELPRAVGNDADLAVLAEHRRGSARGCDNVVFIQGRVGIGAGIILGGVRIGGHAGHAGEIGHIVLDPAGPLCHCGRRGCVETYVGSEALLQSAAVDSLRSLFDHARNGSAEALDAVAAAADPLGRMIATVVNTLNPQRVVLGGHLVELFELLGPRLDAAVSTYALEAADRSVQLVSAGLGSNAALLGAAEAALAQLLTDPIGVLTGGD